MAVITGVMSSATSGKAIYDLIAAQLAANPNWSRPSVSSLTGATNSWGANYTSQIWKCTVGAQVFFLILSYDTTTNVNDLYVQLAEAYDGSDGGGVPAAAKFRRPVGMGGTLNTVSDSTSVTPGATDLMTNADQALNVANPNWGKTNVLGSGSAFSYLFKVGNKSLTIAYSVGGVNRWVHAGAFESLVTGPSDPIPLAQISHGFNSPVNHLGTVSSTTHACGMVSRNPGLGVTAEAGAFAVNVQPLHAPIGWTMGSGQAFPLSTESFGNSVPRWFTKVLMSQAIIHQTSNAQTGLGKQTFRGYFSDLFAGTITGTTEPTGGGVDSVVIDGVTYYWLGINCPGPSLTAAATHFSVLVAVRAD